MTKLATATKPKPSSPRPEVASAWEEYFYTTQRLKGIDYEQIEPKAWSLLQSKLGSLKGKRTV